MSKPFNDELISAYLDGELTAEEQALVERKLSESPAHQQLLSDLAALRDSFDSFATYELDDQFASRVLRASERHMLSGGDARGERKPEAKREVHASTIPVRAADERYDRRRALQLAIGSVATVAALLLITLFFASNSGGIFQHSVSTNTPQSNEASPADEQESTRALGEETGGEEIGGVDHQHPGSTNKKHDDATSDGAGRKEAADDQTAGTSDPKPSEGAFVKDRAQSTRALRTATDPAKAGAAHEEGPDQGSVDSIKSSPAAFAGASPALNADGPGEPLSYTVVVEVPNNQLDRQPVELALASSNVQERGAWYRGRALPETRTGSRRHSESSEESAAANGLSARLAKSNQNVEGELMVVASQSEILKVCKSLNQQGFRTTLENRELQKFNENSPRRSREKGRDESQKRDVNASASKPLDNNPASPRGGPAPTEKRPAAKTVPQAADVPDSRGLSPPSGAPDKGKSEAAGGRSGEKRPAAKATDKKSQADDGAVEDDTESDAPRREHNKAAARSFFYRVLGKDSDRENSEGKNFGRNEQRKLELMLRQLARSPGSDKDAEAEPERAARRGDKSKAAGNPNLPRGDSQRVVVRFIIRPVPSPLADKVEK